jgi:hypothetical protein
MPRRFTLEEASRLLPQVTRLVQRAIALKSEFDEADGKVRAFADRVTRSGGMMVDRDRVLDSRNRRESAVNQLRESIEEIQNLGCQIKDLDSGLVDFLTLFHGVEVCLCWKLGEPAIDYWHGMEEGFRGRKPIDQDFLDHHEGDRE